MAWLGETHNVRVTSSVPPPVSELPAFTCAVCGEGYVAIP